jgi:hypothetical protein
MQMSCHDQLEFAKDMFYAFVSGKNENGKKVVVNKIIKPHSCGSEGAETHS